MFISTLKKYWVCTRKFFYFSYNVALGVQNQSVCLIEFFYIVFMNMTKYFCLLTTLKVSEGFPEDIRIQTVWLWVKWKIRETSRFNMTQDLEICPRRLKETVRGSFCGMSFKLICSCSSKTKKSLNHVLCSVWLVVTGGLPSSPPIRISSFTSPTPTAVEYPQVWL